VCHHRGRGQGVLDIGSGEHLVGCAVNFVARFETGHLLSNGFDDSREFGAEDERQRLLESALSLANKGGPRPDSGGVDAH